MLPPTQMSINFSEEQWKVAKQDVADADPEQLRAQAIAMRTMDKDTVRRLYPQLAHMADSEFQAMTAMVASDPTMMQSFISDVGDISLSDVLKVDLDAAFRQAKAAADPRPCPPTRRSLVQLPPPPKEGLTPDLDLEPWRADGWDALCLVCSDGGEVMCCDGCPRVIHLKCTELSKEPAEDELFFCREECQHSYEAAHTIQVPVKVDGEETGDENLLGMRDALGTLAAKHGFDGDQVRKVSVALTDMSVEDLRALATKNGIDVSQETEKYAIIGAIIVAGEAELETKLDATDRERRRNRARKARKKCARPPRSRPCGTAAPSYEGGGRARTCERRRWQATIPLHTRR